MKKTLVLITWFAVLTSVGTFMCDDQRRQCPIAPRTYEGLWWTNQDGVRCVGYDANLGREGSAGWCLTISKDYKAVGTLGCDSLGPQVYTCGLKE